MNNSVEFAKKVAAHADSLLGNIFTENDRDAFTRHIRAVIAQSDVAVEKRIALLFAIWSNINSLGESLDVSSDEIGLYMHLRDRKFSITSELSVLCPVVVKRVFGTELDLSTVELQNYFVTLLGYVDESSRDQRLTDAQAVESLINILGAWSKPR